MPAKLLPDHDELVARAGRWLRNFAGCGVVLTEVVCNSSSNEIPDAIGWRGETSILIECKTSRADFQADALKPFRVRPERGMGRHRYFMCPEGIIQTADLPRGWGLLWVNGRSVRVLAGNAANGMWGHWPFREADAGAEISLLTSALRRVQETPLMTASA